MNDAVDLRATGDRIEELLDQLQASADPRMLDRADEILRLVTELYGAGLARVVELVRSGAPDLLAELRAVDPTSAKAAGAALLDGRTAISSVGARLAAVA